MGDWESVLATLSRSGSFRAEMLRRVHSAIAPKLQPRLQPPHQEWRQRLPLRRRNSRSKIRTTPADCSSAEQSIQGGAAMPSTVCATSAQARIHRCKLAPPWQDGLMLRRITRLFVIKTRLEAALIIYALALGAAERGRAYLTDYPGVGGQLLFLACMGSVALAGAKLFDCLRHERTS
jgi:hypothetical protein